MPEYPSPLAASAFPSAQPLPSLEGGEIPPRSGTLSCMLERAWGVTEITLSCAGKTSASQHDTEHPPLAGGRDARFFFAPKEESVVVAWKLAHPERATTLTLSLYRAGSATAIWTRTLDAEAARRERLTDAWDGSFPEGEWIGFDDHLVTLEHSPYKLEVTAGADSTDDDRTRWTYFDILVDHIDLKWGTAAALPQGDRDDIDDLYRARTALDEVAINGALALRVGAGGVLDSTHRYDVALPTNQFPTFADDMNDGQQQRRTAFWLQHRMQWGRGVRIPLVAEIHLAKAAGGGVHGGASALALGGAKFTWDWESEDEIAGLGGRGLNGAVVTFLGDALEYKRNDGSGPPGSTNCHQDHGGKRGGDAQVLCALDTRAPAHDHGATRRWAARTTAMRTGPYAGCTGVLFQPSRMFGDTYALTVSAQPDAVGGGAAALDTADAGGTQRASFADLPRARSGTFEVLRSVRIRYVRKVATMTPAVLATIAAEYRRAGLVIDWGNTQPADELALANNFDLWFGQVLANPPQDSRGKQIVAHGAQFEPAAQYQAGTGAGTSHAFVAKGWEIHRDEKLIEATREYVQKDRRFNGPLKAYQRWQNTPNGVDEEAYLRGFYGGLRAAKKRKVDAIVQQKMTLLAPNKDAYEDRICMAAVQFAQAIAERLLVHVNDHGMVIVHYDAPVGYRQPNGTIVVPPSTVGGLSPSASAKWEGRGSVHIVFLPQAPSQDPLAKYKTPVTSVIRHEAGHNFFLCHAPAERGLDPAGGQSPLLHDAADLRCLMNYDQRSDHLCGFCHLKLRGWATIASGDHSLTSMSPGHGTVKVWASGPKNRVP